MGDEKEQQNFERSDGPDEIGSDPNMTGTGAAEVPWQDQILKLVLFTVLYLLNEIGSDPNMTGRGAAEVPWQDQILKLVLFTILYLLNEIYHLFAISIYVCMQFVRRNLTASYQRPDEIGSDPNMTGRGAAEVPWQDQILELVLFTVLCLLNKIYHFFAISICVCMHILCEIRPRRNLTASYQRPDKIGSDPNMTERSAAAMPWQYQSLKQPFPVNTKPYFPSRIHHRFHIYDINPCFTSYEASFGESEIDPKKKDGEDGMTSMIDDDLFSKVTAAEFSLPSTHHSFAFANTVESNQQTILSDYKELFREDLEFPSYSFDAEGQCSSSTQKDCWILCSDPTPEQVMAAFPPPEQHVTFTASTLLVEERRAQSLQCLTESNAQDNLAQGHFLEEGRFVEMGEKLESTPPCMQISQPAATDIRGQIISANKSCIAMSHPEKKNKIETREIKCRKLEDGISFADLQQNFDKKRSDAAESLSVSLSTLKRVSRKYGIDRWPYSTKKTKLVTKSIQDALGAFNPSTSSHTAVGSNYQHSQGSKAPKPQEERLLTLCKKPSIGGQVEIADHMLESSLSAHEGQLQEQNRVLFQKQDAGSVTIKATYGEDIVKVQSFLPSGIFELKKELAMRLDLDHDSINVKYQDEDGDWILMACDSALHECLTYSRGNKVIRLLVLDKVSKSNNSNKAAGH